MSKKTKLIVAFGAEILVCALVFVIMGVLGFSWPIALVLLLVLAMSAYTFFRLYRQLPADEKAPRIR